MLGRGQSPGVYLQEMYAIWDATGSLQKKHLPAQSLTSKKLDDETEGNTLPQAGWIAVVPSPLHLWDSS